MAEEYSPLNLNMIMQKSKRKKGWIITWEGSEPRYRNGCKVIAVLPSRFGVEQIKTMLPYLFIAEYGFTLDELVYYGFEIHKCRMLKEEYKDINPSIACGFFPKSYLSARRVKNLKCEENPNNMFESTLYWTELPKYIPKLTDDAENYLDSLKQVSDEKHDSYTYATRQAGGSS